MADTCVVFYGIQFKLNEDDIELCESRTHQHIVAARKVGLDHYWGNFGSPAEKYLLLIGKKLGLLGVENSYEIRIDNDSLLQSMSTTRQRLEEANFHQSPCLLANWQPDE